jgi:hypothetical protein
VNGLAKPFWSRDDTDKSFCSIQKGRNEESERRMERRKAAKREKLMGASSLLLSSRLIGHFVAPALCLPGRPIDVERERGRERVS